MDPKTIAQCPAVVNVPAWTTAEYHDKDGNLVAKFDAPRPFAKDCVFNHDNAGAPFTVSFTDAAPAAEHQDLDLVPKGAIRV